ncbi:efflux RND transporter periplasmic adaptor subunit [Bradyrhizobium sp.]|uniref:HlyD family secretion protein n=1 Tax=Bradyrhizobium sp. TaxID=376 RepID=UPI0025C28EA3|nr:efflux RND transporter periplasmic adaptor subunit [Bradyrhizobium sp.]
MSKRRIAVAAALAAIAVLGVLFVVKAAGPGRPAMWGLSADTPPEKRWQAVAPGRVEACSGQIKVAAAVLGVVHKVLVKANDKVFAGEPLIQLADDELRARLAAAETQVAIRERARDERSATGSARTRRRAQDAMAEAERAQYEAQAAVDRAAAKLRAHGGPDADLTAARLALTRAQNELLTKREELRTAEDDAALPTSLEGQLSIARSELAIARATLDKMTVRAPIDGTVLQVNVRMGEAVSPGSPQPPLQLADLSSLCVRAELDERDIGAIRVGQAATVRVTAFPGREFEGSVASVAPLVEPGRLEPPGSRNQSEVDIVRVMVAVTGPGELTVGMKADVYFQPDKITTP